MMFIGHVYLSLLRNMGIGGGKFRGGRVGGRVGRGSGRGSGRGRGVGVRGRGRECVLW